MLFTGRGRNIYEAQQDADRQRLNFERAQEIGDGLHVLAVVVIKSAYNVISAMFFSYLRPIPTMLVFSVASAGISAACFAWYYIGKTFVSPKEWIIVIPYLIIGLIIAIKIIELLTGIRNWIKMVECREFMILRKIAKIGVPGRIAVAIFEVITISVSFAIGCIYGYLFPPVINLIITFSWDSFFRTATIHIHYIFRSPFIFGPICFFALLCAWNAIKHRRRYT